MAAPVASTGFRGTQVFSTFGSTPKSSLGVSGTPPSSVIGGASEWQQYTMPSAGTYSITAARASSTGNVCAAVFTATPPNSTPSGGLESLTLLGEGSGTGSTTVSFTTTVSNQTIWFAVDSFDGSTDLFTIPNPIGTVQQPIGAKIQVNGVDHFQPTCATTGATILYKQSSSSTWLTYTGPVSLANVPEKTYFDIIAVKQDWNKSSQASWRYLI